MSNKIRTFLKSFSSAGRSRRSSSWNSMLVFRSFSILRMLSATFPSPPSKHKHTQIFITNELHSMIVFFFLSFLKELELTSDGVAVVIHHHRLVACFDQLHHAVAPDVAGSTCDQHLLSHPLGLWHPAASQAKDAFFRGSRPASFLPNTPQAFVRAY